MKRSWMTAAEYRESLKEKKTDRQGSVAVRTSHAGMSFASKLEAAVWDQLCLEQIAGCIRDLRAQVTVRLTDAEIGWRIDFAYVNCRDGSNEFAEAKGLESEAYLLKLKLWRFYGLGPLRIYKGSWQQPRLVETVYPRRRG